jgi:L-lysine exporter family protein LysE/ArgO
VLVFTWANPHVYLDTVGLIGAVAATYGRHAGPSERGAGGVLPVLSDSGLRRAGLAPVLRAAFGVAVLDAIVGVTMLGLALKLGLWG